jgi:hypothetical protein
MQGVNQAKMLLQTNDPNVTPEMKKQAQSTIDQNTSFIQEMLSDDKFRKSVEKGFQISLTDPSQNKTPDHNLIQRGIDLFRGKQQTPTTPQAAQQMTQRFMSKQPQMMAPNPMAMQMMQTRMEMDKMRAEGAKGMIDWAKAKLEETGKIETEKWKAAVEANNQAVRTAGEIKVAEMNKSAQEVLAEIQHNYKMTEEFPTIWDNASKTYANTVNQQQERLANIDKELQDAEVGRGALGRRLEGKEKEDVKASLYVQREYAYKQIENARQAMEDLRNYAIKKWGVPEITIPMPDLTPPKVGEGVGAHVYPYTSGQHPADQSIDPRSGKKWDRSVPPAARPVISGIHSINQLIDSISSGVRSAERAISKEFSRGGPD